MQSKTVTTIKLTPEEVKAIIREHFNAKENASVYFSIGTVGDDRFGTAPQGLTGVELQVEIDSERLAAFVRGDAIPNIRTR